MDLARVRSIAAGDAQFVGELLQTYLVSAEQSLAELRAAADGGDRGALARSAHKLKGASGNVGAVRTGQLAARLESLAPAAEPGELARAIEMLEMEAHRVQRFVRTHLQQ